MSATLDRFRVVLVATSHPGNIGAAARAMLTMGLTRLVLVNPRRFPDADALALASGAVSVLDAAHGGRDARRGARELRAGDRIVGKATRIRRPRPAGTRCRCRGGRECESRRCCAGIRHRNVGLSNRELAQCSLVATIPANEDYGSLNLAAAVQVVAYELRIALTGDAVWRAPRFAPATADEIEGLYAHATKTLAAMRFLNPQRPKRLLPRLRRLFARAGLEKEEVNILRGILARIDELIERKAKS
jgi:tRNA/rRNA methyltransferase